MLFPFCVFQTIMKDRWMNMGFEEEELLPFKEPTLDISDQKRIEMLVTMGYPRTEVEESLRLHKFDDTYASYLLLGRKSTDVSTHHNNNSSTYNNIRVHTTSHTSANKTWHHHLLSILVQNFCAHQNSKILFVCL